MDLCLFLASFLDHVIFFFEDRTFRKQLPVKNQQFSFRNLLIDLRFSFRNPLIVPRFENLGTKSLMNFNF